MSRSIILVLHPSRPEAHRLASEVVQSLNKEDISVWSATEVSVPGVESKSNEEIRESIKKHELVLVLGGDGTILRGAEIAHGTDIPVLGINLGHVGFLAQIKKPTVNELVSAIKNRSYKFEKRMTLAYRVVRGES
ncbi:MAG: NAD kinase, partial [Actinobacteria bacterium]|nr:NAD kinase [Actinomycetota bacterium]